MKKKIVTLCLVVALAAIAVVGGTLAYFTDTDTETNTFTVGNVEIDLIESQYHRVNAGKGYTMEQEPIIGGYLWASGVELEGTEDNTPDKANYSWTGTYFSDEQIQEDAETYKTGYFATESVNMVPGDNVRKNPYVINKSTTNAAYVRVRVLVPTDLFVILDNGLSYWNTTALEDGVVSKAVESYNKAASVEVWVEGTDDDQFIVKKTVGAGTEAKEISYYQFDFTYPKALEPGEMTFWNVWGNIAIDKKATAEDLENVSSFDVIFEADAIQAEGFASAADAFAAFDE